MSEVRKEDLMQTVEFLVQEHGSRLLDCTIEFEYNGIYWTDEVQALSLGTGYPIKLKCLKTPARWPQYLAHHTPARLVSEPGEEITLSHSKPEPTTVKDLIEHFDRDLIGKHLIIGHESGIWKCIEISLAPPGIKLFKTGKKHLHDNVYGFFETEIFVTFEAKARLAGEDRLDEIVNMVKTYQPPADWGEPEKARFFHGVGFNLVHRLQEWGLIEK